MKLYLGYLVISTIKVLPMFNYSSLVTRYVVGMSASVSGGNALTFKR